MLADKYLEKDTKVRFFGVASNVFDNRSFPIINKITDGEIDTPSCGTCGATRRIKSGTIAVSLAPERGIVWPDILGYNKASLLIISDKVVRAWKVDSLPLPPVHLVRIERPYPFKMLDNPPGYFWIDGEQACGAALDNEKSTIPDPGFCLLCGQIMQETSGCIRYPEVWQCSILEDSWNGMHIFTSNASPHLFFCTHAVVTCASRHRLSNFHFMAMEEK